MNTKPMITRLLNTALSLGVLRLLISCVAVVGLASQALAAEPVRYGYRVIKSYPSEINAFTQGLVFHEGFLFRGTGKRGDSKLSKIDLESGEVLLEHDLSNRYFGEGIEIVGDRLFQLTWQSNLVFEYDKSNFDILGTHYNPTEGWGLAFDGENLFLSDGSARLHKVDPVTFSFIDALDVTFNGQPVANLNELEFIAGEIWANVWQTDFIVRIDPTNGVVVGVIDLTGLAERTARNGVESVLNGIAYDAEKNRLFVTGKYWSTIFEIELVEH